MKRGTGCIEQLAVVSRHMSAGRSGKPGTFYISTKRVGHGEHGNAQDSHVGQGCCSVHVPFWPLSEPSELFREIINRHHTSYVHGASEG